MAGLRVVRGPNWKSWKKDGGEGYVGTVTEVLKGEEKVVVIWDNGTRKVHRAGHEDAFDLYIFDNAQIGVRHPTVTCDACYEDGIKGIRWKCSVCDNYDLCSSCYGQDKHDMSHSFFRYDTKTSTGKQIASRHDSKKQKLKAKGIFEGATVTRGVHWRWEDQDGGEKSKGSVIDIDDWESSFRAEVKVKWTNGSTNSYRVGRSGKVDLKCVKPAPGGVYYKGHLPHLDANDCDSQEDSDDDDSDDDDLGDDDSDDDDSDDDDTDHLLDLLVKAFETESEETISQSEETVKPGIRVIRGPDWTWDNQDGGEGHVGTVTEVGSTKHETIPDKCVSVVWDNGSRNMYRIGQENAFDLRVLDNAPSGVEHSIFKCDSCNSESIQGIRWKCGLCFDYDLCSNCYSRNEHEITHFFWRYEYPTNKRFKVPRRSDSKRFESKGISVGAVVSRGLDWQWGAQDAGANGVVLNIKQWSQTANSAADVLWANGNQNCYRVGYMGKCDLKLVTASSGGYYYKDHLPILGKVEVSPCDFKVGDTVRCCYAVELLKILQRNHGGWTDDMEKYVTLNGTVIQVSEDNDITVKYGDDKRWYFNSDAMSKVDDLTSVTSSPIDSDVVRKVIELGFDKMIVEKVALKHFSEGSGCFSSVDALIDKVLEVQGQESLASVVQTVSQISGSNNEMTDAPSVASGAVNTASHSETLSENQRLAEENRRLKEQRQCKICMDLEACITFVPCGHLVSCDECYTNLMNCPICRGRIESILRTYIS